MNDCPRQNPAYRPTPFLILLLLSIPRLLRPLLVRTPHLLSSYRSQIADYIRFFLLQKIYPRNIFTIFSHAAKSLTDKQEFRNFCDEIS